MEKKALDNLKRLLELSTFKGNISSEMTNQIEDILTEQGYNVQRVIVKGIPHYLATIEGEGPHIAFIGHYDVVPAKEKWLSDPFIPREENEKIYARGASDMKSALAVQISSGAKLAGLGLKISLFISGDEETDSLSMPELLKLSKTRIDCIIGGEPTSLETTGDMIKYGRRGVIQGRVVLKGLGGHSAYGEKARNPIHLFLEKAKGLLFPIDSGDENFPETSIQITNIKAGEGTLNVIPGELEFTFDIRNSASTSKEKVLEILKDRLNSFDCEYSIEIILSDNPYLTKDATFINITKELIKEIIGIEPKLSCSGGTSDCRFFSEAFPETPIIEIGVPSSNIHGANEFVKISDIETLERIYLGIGKKLLEKSKPLHKEKRF